MDIRSVARRSIFGASGLRGGWGLIAYWVIFIATGYAFLRLTVFIFYTHRVAEIVSAFLWSHVSGIHAQEAGFAGEILFVKSTILVSALVSTALLACIERRPIRSYWIAVAGNSKRLFLTGGVLGFGLFGTIIGLIALGGGYSFGKASLSGAEAVVAGLGWIAGATIYAVADSLALFGYPFFTLRRSVGFAPAALLVGLLFSAYQWLQFGRYTNTPLTTVVLGGTAIFSQAIFYSMTMRRKWNLAFTAGIYAGVVYAQDFVFSVTDSGLLPPFILRQSYHHPPDWLDGADAGPKASALALAVYLVAIIFAYLWQLRQEHRGQSSPA